MDRILESFHLTTIASLGKLNLKFPRDAPITYPVHPAYPVYPVHPVIFLYQRNETPPSTVNV